jgi:type II secretory ATPase GspE/PulE/Tfp pilus assembly ATPase PilB-like protein
VNVDALTRLRASRTSAEANAAVEIVDALLAASAAAGASDLHLLPTPAGLNVSWRIDGVLLPLGRVPKDLAENVVARLKVLARLLTYRTNVPQEGRIVAADHPVEVRISTFPTLFGEKVVARNLPRQAKALSRIGDLGLPGDVARTLADALRQTSGALVIAGPAGSGKTTTAYAALRAVIEFSGGQRSVASLEDPVEAVIEGVAQSQVAEAAGFDLLTALRSLVRQDPEVIFLGEIRDAEAAGVALQAALTGQLVITTFHATDAAVALSRLGEMGIPPYAIRTGVRTVIALRLLRRLCRCAEPGDDQTAGDARVAGLELAAPGMRRPVGCEACRRTGYAGRVAVAEALEVGSPAVADAVLNRRDADTLRSAAVAGGMMPLLSRALALVSEGVTSVAEVLRVFGLPADVRTGTGGWLDSEPRGAGYNAP